ncbi:ras and Rab interactor 3-like [Ascaphus truei]|uniref:ras and Rab interactor 3-like n=1 Tax=Ascaphus truei TaxID=8439 RepID=UPI003F5A1E15
MKLDMSPSNKQQFCSIRVTSMNGALCVINPLYLHEHGDNWLTNISPHQEERRKSVPWCKDQSIENKDWSVKKTLEHRHKPEKINPDIEDMEVNHLNETERQLDGLTRCERLEIDKYHKVPLHQEETPRRSQRSNVEVISRGFNKVKEHSDTQGEIIDISRKSKVEILRRSKRETGVRSKESQEGNKEVQESHARDNEMLDQPNEKRQSLFPHRVSWIEVEHLAEWTLKKSNSETSLISSDSFLLPPLLELDSVSNSSVEEEGDCHSLIQKRKHSHGLGNKVRHSLQTVSSMLTGLVSPEKYLGNRIQQLAEDPASYIGGTIQPFICHMLNGSGNHQSSIEMLQSIRKQLTNLKIHLLKSNEVCEILQHHEIDDFKIAAIIETSLYKCVLKPLRDIIHSQLLNIHSKDGSLAKLLANQQKMKAKSLSEPELRAGLPGSSTMEKIQQKFSIMHVAYSPEKMIRLLLKVCKLIYESMEASSEKKEAFGADDFLPALIHVLIGCDLSSVQLDVEYIMELVDPSQLQGEGGYYLTTLFGALYHISSFNTVSRQLSVEAQNSIRQWKHRRTIHHKHAMQNSATLIKRKQRTLTQNV